MAVKVKKRTTEAARKEYEELTRDYEAVRAEIKRLKQTSGLLELEEQRKKLFQTLRDITSELGVTWADIRAELGMGKTNQKKAEAVKRRATKRPKQEVPDDDIKPASEPEPELTEVDLLEDEMELEYPDDEDDVFEDDDGVLVLDDDD